MNRVGRFLRRALLVLTALILLVGLVLWSAGERIYPRLLEIAARDYAGIVLSVRGPVSVQLWPEARISASDLDVAAAASAAWAAQLQKISVQIDARSALRGRLVIERIELQGAQMKVEEVVSGGTGMLDVMPGLAQAHIRIDDARVEIKTTTEQKSRTIQIDHYTSGPDADGKPHLKARGSVDGGTLSVDAQFSAEAERVGSVMAFPLTASVSIPGWKLDGTVQGHVVSPLQGRGLLLETMLDIGDVAPLAQMFDLAELPSGHLKLHATLDGDLPSPRLTKLEATLEDGKALSASAEGVNIALASGAVESLHLRFRGPLSFAGLGKRSVARQVDIDATLKGSPGQYKARGSVDGVTLSVDAQFSAEAQRIGGVMAFPLTASVSIPGWKLDGTVQGHVVSPLQGRGLLLETMLDIGDVAPLAQMFDLAGLPSGHLKLRATLDGDLPSPRLTKLEATLEDGKALSASAKGVGIALASGAVESLHLRFRGPLSFAGSGKRSVAHQVDIDATLKGSPGQYKVKMKRWRDALSAKSWVEAHGDFELAALADWAAAHGWLDVQAKSPSISALSHLLGGGPRSDLGPVVLSGKLTGTLVAATIKDMQLRIGADGPVQIVARGQAGPFDLGSAKNAALAADVQVEMQVREAKALQANPHDVFVKLQPWAGHARLRLAPAHWRLTGLDVKAGSERTAQVTISGKASGRGDLPAGIQRLVTGALKKGDSADLDVVLKTVSSKATGQMIGVNVPELGALQVRAHVQEEDGALAMRGLELQSEGELALKLVGDIGALGTLQDVELKLTLAPTLHDNIDRLLDLELPLNGDVSLQATLRRPGQQVLSVAGAVQVGSSKLALDLTAEQTATVPLVKGRIHSASILAADFWPTADATAPSPSPSSAPSAAAPEAARPSKTAASSGGLGPLGLIPGLDFVLQGVAGEPQPTPSPQGKRTAAPASAAPAASGDGALPWSRLQHVDIALDVHVDTVRGVHLDGGPLKFRLVDQAGRLEFGPAQLDFKGGSVTLHGVADANDKPPSVTVEGRGKDLPVAELAAHSGVRSDNLDGQLSFNYDLKAQGQTLVDLRASLNGDIDALVEHGKFPLADMDRLSGSVTTWLTSWIPGGEQTQVPCAVSRFSIKGGLAEAQTLYLKTERSAAYGIGTIDLRSDTLDLTITPKVSGLSLSPPPTVRIHGPLADPDVDVANASAVLLKYGEEVATSMAFPPAILLRHLLGRATSSESTPCR